ncbi:hypothetical protein ACFX1X_017059 [Malus domestica]
MRGAQSYLMLKENPHGVARPPGVPMQIKRQFIGKWWASGDSIDVVGVGPWLIYLKFKMVSEPRDEPVHPREWVGPHRPRHSPSETLPKLDLENLRALKVLSNIAMGTVFLVHDPSSNPSTCLLFALKVVDKSTLRSKLDAERYAHWEIQVLTKLSSPNPHPFLPFIMGSFESNMGWAVPYCPVF